MRQIGMKGRPYRHLEGMSRVDVDLASREVHLVS